MGGGKKKIADWRKFGKPADSCIPVLKLSPKTLVRYDAGVHRMLNSRHVAVRVAGARTAWVC